MQSANAVCAICKIVKEDPQNLGNLLTVHNETVHQNCLLLASNISRRDNDNEERKPVSKAEFRTILKRARTRQCVYCKSNGATIKCRGSRCKRIFHLPCGLMNGSVHELYGKYFSYCKVHCPPPKPSEPKECPICYESINLENLTDILWGPCCKNFYYHKPCVETMGLNAGVSFKCPMCNDTDTFMEAMQLNGIYIPNCAATYNNPMDVPNLVETIRQCAATECVCDRGISYFTAEGDWKLVLCQLCGANGTHLRCSNLEVGETWHCSVCSPVEQQFEQNMRQLEIFTGLSVTTFYIPWATTFSINTRYTRKRKRGSSLMQHRSSASVFLNCGSEPENYPIIESSHEESSDYESEIDHDVVRSHPEGVGHRITVSSRRYKRPCKMQIRVHKRSTEDYLHNSETGQFNIIM